MTYLMVRQWHVIAMTYRGGAVKTRCGIGPLVVAGTLTTTGETRVRRTTDDLPVNDKTCNRCLALAVNDAEAGPDNDVVA